MDLTTQQTDLIAQYLQKNLSPAQLEQGHFLDRLGDQDVRVDLADIDLEFFNRFYLAHHFSLPPAPIHRILTRKLQALVETPGRCNGVYVMPRGHAKTTIGTLGLPLWCTVFGKKHHIPIISDSWDQAKDQLSTIKVEIEDNDLLIEDFGQLRGNVWQASDIFTTNQVRLRALGQGMKVRGRKIGQRRPDLIVCHAKGTWIDCDEGHILVENHSRAVEQVADGYRVRVHGLPFEETVTTDHRYWTWKDGVSAFRMAKDLDKDTYIGWPINVEIGTTHKILGYERSVTITERNDKGQVVQTAPGQHRPFDHPWFSDPEFWWLVGLWWGDGSISPPGSITLFVSPSQEATIGAHIARFLNTKGRAFSIQHPGGAKYSCYVFSDTPLQQWLRSWIYGRHLRKAPDWVLQLPPEFQACLLKGHIDANGYVDTKTNNVRITSICLPTLLQLRAMLARLGICASIRKGVKAHVGIIEGRRVNCHEKYDLRFRDGASKLGYPIQDQARYKVRHQFIADGFLWSKLREKTYVPEETFVSVYTASGTYTTEYGLSRNCDDLEEIQSVQSQAQREALLRWFRGSLMRSGWTDTAVVVLGNYLHHDCLLANLVANPLFDSIVFRALEEWPERLDLWDRWRAILVNLADPHKKEHALEFFQEHEAEMTKGAQVAWPEAHPLYDLMVIRVSEGDASFNMELQNNPQDPTKQLFTYYGRYRQELRGTDIWLVPTSGRPAARLQDCAIFAFTDPSMGSSIRSDFSAILILAKTILGQMFVLEADIKRRPPDQIMKDQILYAQTYRITRWGIEKNQFQALFATQSAQESAAKNIYLPVQPVNQLANKALRIQSLQPDLENQYILLPVDGMELLKQQLAEYPSGAHDDGPDALEGARTIAKQWEPLSGSELVQGELHQFAPQGAPRPGELGIMGGTPTNWDKYDKLADETIAAFEAAKRRGEEAVKPESMEQFLAKVLRVGDAI